MSDLTEIYICKPGQELKQGKLEHSNISTKAEAEKDAKSRCKYDPTIGRVAYYAVDESGKFRNFYTYDNTKAAFVPKPRPASGAAAKPTPVRKPQRAPTLFQRIRAAFEVD
jgi:hypothetical protein